MSTLIPSVGRIVHYVLTEGDAREINSRRNQRRTSSSTVGYNEVRGGEVYPLLITRVSGETSFSAANGQVFLDGDDNLWVTGRYQGAEFGCWFAPPRLP